MDTQTLSFEERNRIALEQRAAAVLEILPAGRPVLVEVGVHTASLSAYLLDRRPDLHWVGVDSWLPTDQQSPHYKATGDARAFDTAEQQAEWKRQAYAAIKPYGDRAQIMEMDSLAAAATFKPESVDCAFIDACHLYGAVLDDCRAWWPTVKPSGWLSGHDFLARHDFDVNRAVREFADAVKLPHIVLTGTVWAIRKP